MVRGAGAGESPGATGGADTTSLTRYELPDHTHPYQDIYHSEVRGVVDVGGYGSSGSDGDNRGYQMLRTSESAGFGAPFSILPAYYTLAFIIFLPDHTP